MDHVDQVRLTGVRLVVQPAGRARVLREHRKNVHAFITGERVPMVAGPYNPDQEISYNPYKCGSFVLRATGEPITEANSVTLTAGGHAYIS